MSFCFMKQSRDIFWIFEKKIVFWFLWIFFVFINIALWEVNQKPQVSGRGVIVEQNSEIWDSWLLVQHIRGTFVLLAFKVILRSFGALAIFRNLGLMIRDSTFWMAMRAKWWELDMWLLYMLIGNHVWRVQWHHICPWVPLKGQIQGHSDFEALYLVKEHILGIKWHYHIWPWVTLKGQIQGHSHFEALYIIKEQSPILFNIFINDITPLFQEVSSSPLKLTNTIIGSLLYADDLVILSTSKEGLQNSLDKLGAFCSKWKLEINRKKSKIMFFSRGGRKTDTAFKVGHENIECSGSYSYLGV